MMEVVIPYFIEHEKQQYIIEYSELMASYFEDRHKYKSAVQYYHIVCSALKKAYAN
jgi:hypothetical protein